MRLGLVVAAVVSAVLSSTAAQAGILEDCRQPEDQGLAVTACTASLETLKLDSASRATVYIRRGDAYSDLKDFDRAIADYNEAIRLDPSSALAFNARGVVFNRQGQPDRAIDDFGEALRRYPKYSEAYRNRGVAYSAKGRLERAIADFDFATRMDPNNIRAFHERATIRAKLGHTDLAVEDFDQAIKLSANSSDAETYRQQRADVLATAPRPQAEAESSHPAASCPVSMMHWRSVESIATVPAYEDHIARFPNCAFATLAKERIAALQQKASAPALPVTRQDDESQKTSASGPSIPAASPEARLTPAPPAFVPVVGTSSAPTAPAPTSRAAVAPVVRVRPEPRPVARARPARQPARSATPVVRESAPVRAEAAPRTLDCTNPAGLIACWERVLSTLPIAQPFTPRGVAR